MHKQIDNFFRIIERDEVLPFTVALCFAVASILTYSVYAGVDFDVTNLFAHRAIGGAVLSGQNSGMRGQVFWTLTLTFILSFCLVFYCVSFLMQKILQSNLLIKTRIERSTLMQVSLLSFPCLIMEALHYGYGFALKFLASLGVVSLFFMICKVFCKRNQFQILLRILCQYRTLLIVFSGFSGLYFSVVSFADNFQTQLFGLHSFFVLLISIVSICCWRWFFDKKLTQKKLVFFYPLVLLPILLPFSNELQYWLTRYVIISQQWVYACLVFITILLSFYWVYSCREFPPPKKAINSFIFPVIIVTFVVFVYWKAQVSLALNDLLHPGNFIVPAKQIVKDGTLPFIEFWPDLGMQASLPSSIYNWLFGFQEFDALIYSFLPRIIGAVCLYILLGKYYAKQWALLCIILLPFVMPATWIEPEKAFWFPNRISYTLFVVLCIGWVMQSCRLNRLILLWLLVLVCIAWVPSTGKAVLFTIITILLMRMLSGNKLEIKNILVSFVIVFSLAFGCYCLLLHFNGYQISQSIKYVLTLGLAEKFVFSRPNIVSAGINGVALWYYAITPLILIGANGLIVFRLIRGRFVTPHVWMISCLTLLSFFAGLRSLQRHSLIERYCPLFFILFATLIPFLFLKRPKYLVFWSTLVFSVGALCLPASSQFDQAMGVDVKNWSSSHTRRVVIDDQMRFQVVADFLKRHVGVNQTYVEFVHGHLLYALSDHVVPPFHRAARILSSADAQTIYLKYLEKYYNDDRIPFVILDGSYWGSHVDKIPVPMAVFCIAEFINSHYTPFAEVGGFRIFKAKNSKISYEPSKELLLSKANLGYQDYETNNVDIRVGDGKLSLSARGSDPYIENILKYARNPVGLLLDGQYAVRMSVKSNVSGYLSLYFGMMDKEYSEKYSLKIPVHPSQKAEDYVVSIPMQTYGQTLSKLRVDIPENSTVNLNRFELIEQLDDKLTSKKIEYISQDFPMKKLPYIWGNFDEMDKWREGKVLFQNLNRIKITPSRTETIKIPKDLQKDSNYIHFRIQTNSPGNVMLMYGNKKKNTVEFEMVPSEAVVDYVIRISSQWAWQNQDFNSINVECDQVATIVSFAVLQAD